MTFHQSLAEWSSWVWPFLANHLWQSTLMSIAAFGTAVLLKNAPGRARYAVWLIASAKFVVPSALLVSAAQQFGLDFNSLFASNSATGEGFTVISQLTAPIIQFDQSTSRDTITAGSHNELWCVLSIVWFTGCALLVALWWRRRQRFRSTIRSAPRTLATRERLVLSRVRSQLDIRRDVELSVLPGTIEPGVWGVWRPVVLLPESMAEELSDAELEAVMMHELIHVRRWDNLAANLHRLLCCVLWFHPIVWVLDRLLLREREQACDEEVIRLGGASDVYASSLLKVLRFCLGWSIAGASNATGSNLGRRVERIMSGNVQLKLSVWHRAAVGSIAALVITLSIAIGFFSREGVVAQSKSPGDGVIQDRGAGGAIGGDTGYAIAGGQDNLIERLDKSPEMAVEFKNSAKAPLWITDAKAKAVLRSPDEPGDEYAVLPVVTLANNTDRRIKGFVLEFRNGLERRGYYESVPSLVERRGVHTSGAQRRLLFLTGGTSGWTVRVGGVIFEDNDVWGTVPPPPPPPPPPAGFKSLDQAPEIAIGFKNLEGAPLSITSATLKAQRGSHPNSEDRYLIKLAIQLVNKTGRRISDVAIAYTNPESKDRIQTYSSVKIDPYGSYLIGSLSQEQLGYGAFSVPERMEAQVIGAKFEDGEVWGSLPSPSRPPPPPPPPQPGSEPDSPKLIRKSGGVMMNSATHRVDAEYPPLARAARVRGSVVVEVTIDEAGLVIGARAISGHPLLKDSAVSAARQWQFTPTMLAGVPTRVIGMLTFNFEP